MIERFSVHQCRLSHPGHCNSQNPNWTAFAAAFIQGFENSSVQPHAGLSEENLPCVLNRKQSFRGLHINSNQSQWTLEISSVESLS